MGRKFGKKHTYIREFPISETIELIPWIKKLMAEKTVMIFSKNYCPFCKEAKDLLYRYKIHFYCIELNEVNKGTEI